MEYLVQLEEYGRVVYNARHRGPNPATALRRALEAHNPSGPGEAYLANKHHTIWVYTYNRNRARALHKAESTTRSESLLSGNVRLSFEAYP